MSPIKNLEERYRIIQPRYEKTAEEISYILKSEIEKVGLEVVITNRAKSIESLIKKTERKTYSDPLDQITDLAGVRVVCYYEADLSKISDIIQNQFQIHQQIETSDRLGDNRMGYGGTHFVVCLGDEYRGGRYSDITSLKCEIQVRTVLQDAWASISHQLIYKNESSVPHRLRRDLNNVSALLEIAQSVFDSVKDKKDAYIYELEKDVEELLTINQSATKQKLDDFLDQPIDLERMMAYARWKFPNLPAAEALTLRLLNDLDRSNYPTLRQIDEAVNKANSAVEEYRAMNPSYFKFGIDYITKSLGFTDLEFRARHGFAKQTREAFKQYEHLVRK